MANYYNVSTNIGGVISAEWNDVEIVNYQHQDNAGSALPSTVIVPRYTILVYDTTLSKYVVARTSLNIDENSNIVITGEELSSSDTNATVFTKAIVNSKYLKVWDNTTQSFVAPTNINLSLHPRFKDIR